MKIPILCPKCNNPVYKDLEELKKIKLIKCNRCGFPFKNPALMNDVGEMIDNIKKAGDC